MTPSRWLVLCAVAYGVTHHLGLLPALEAGGGTRWNDWLDLLVPYVVVGPALAALAAAAAGRRDWTAGLVGAGLYTSGHGIHLAANSVANARGDAAPVHLWDEVVGHALWYAGVAVLAAVVCRAVRPAPTPAALALGAATGITWATNAAGADGLELAGLAVAAALTAYGLRLRSRVLAVTFGTGTVVLAALLGVRLAA